MDPNFWGKMSDEYLRENPEPPLMTSESLAAFEKHIGFKLPKGLSDLLYIKNGGPVQNDDFRFNGEDYEVTYIKGVIPNDTFNSIRSYTDIWSEPAANALRKRLQKLAGDLSKLLLFAEPNGHPYAFALNYNQLNCEGEPAVFCIYIESEDDLQIKQVTDSFSEFLAGQYSGDEKPTVDLQEVGKYQLVAEGGYKGRYRGVHEEGSLTLNGLPVAVRWKICSQRNCFIVFQEIDWAGKIELVREEIKKSALAFDFPSLESFGVDVEPELAKMIRPAVEMEILSKYDADLVPDCYELLLHVNPGGKQMVKVNQSLSFQGRWKNRESKLLYSSIKSPSKPELQKVLQAVLNRSGSSLDFKFLKGF